MCAFGNRPFSSNHVVDTRNFSFFPSSPMVVSIAHDRPKSNALFRMLARTFEKPVFIIIMDLQGNIHQSFIGHWTLGSASCFRMNLPQTLLGPRFLALVPVRVIKTPDSLSTLCPCSLRNIASTCFTFAFKRCFYSWQNESMSLISWCSIPLLC